MLSSGATSGLSDYNYTVVSGTGVSVVGNVIQGEFLPAGALGDLRSVKRPDLDLDLAAAVREFYKQILDEPLSVAMLEKWDRLSAFVAAVVEMAGKYVPLVEAEISSKLDD